MRWPSLPRPGRPRPGNEFDAAESVPPPPDEVEEDDTLKEMTNDDPRRPANMQMTNDGNGRSPEIGHGATSSDPASPYEDEPLPTNGTYKMLVVEIRASGNWKEACRQSFRLAERYVGNATLRLQLAGQDLVMDFPNHRVGCEVELIEQLERVPGVGRVCRFSALTSGKGARAAAARLPPSSIRNS